MSDLRIALAECAPVYEIPDDDLVREVLIPGLRVANDVSIGAGFFTSGALAQIAPGIAALIANPRGRLRLLLSPHLSTDDRAAIRDGLRPEHVLDASVLGELIKASENGSALEKHCLDCLAYLVGSRRLELRMVLMEEGFYHKKIWILRDGLDRVAIHGSGNATARGLLVNGEQMSVDRPWNDGDVAGQRVSRLSSSFDRQWKGSDRRTITLEAAAALDFLDRLNAAKGADDVPTVADFYRAWREDFQNGRETIPPSEEGREGLRRLRVPEGLDFRSGRYAHQGKAVDALIKNGGGIAAIATGGGKTKTALITATAFQDSSAGANVLFVIVPSRPLIQQWASEILEFGIEPTILSDLNPAERKRELVHIESGLGKGRRNTTVILCTNSLFRSENGFRDWVRRLAPKCTFTLIADEVHNFGAVRALAALPEDVKWRIGLSATPRRQYDPEGTHRLNEYFGEEVFEFSVAEAISSGCLVPYDYFPHIVTLSPDEAVRFEELSDRIRQLGFLSDIEGDSFGDSDSHLEALLRERRAIVEQAHAKLDSLRVLLAGRGTDLQHALFYCSAKAPVIDPRRQIEKVNELLMEERILFHQVTNEETGSQLAEEILSAFSRGDLQALTAMKVLDEGVDIPQTRTAFLLASSSVQREWVQRRGRVLRQAPGKATATLHDFVVSPAGLSQSAGRSLLKSEISRVIAFGRDSRNQYSPNGSLSVVESLEDTLHGR